MRQDRNKALRKLQTYTSTQLRDRTAYDASRIAQFELIEFDWESGIHCSKVLPVLVKEDIINFYSKFMTRAYLIDIADRNFSMPQIGLTTNTKFNDREIKEIKKYDIINGGASLYYGIMFWKRPFLILDYMLSSACKMRYNITYEIFNSIELLYRAYATDNI